MSSKGLVLVVLALSFQFNLIFGAESEKIRCESIESLDLNSNFISPVGINQLRSPSEGVSLEGPKGQVKLVSFNCNNFSDEEKVASTKINSFENDFIDEDYLAERELFRRTDKFDSKYDKLSLPWTKDDYLPAYEAALKSDLKLLKKIKEQFNIPLDKMDLKTGEMPLHAAYRTGNPLVIHYITTHSVNNVAPLSKSGMTPFHCAVDEGNYDFVAFILEQRNLLRFKISLPDNQGRTPLMTAALKGYEAIFFNLLRFYSLPEYMHKDKSGRSLISLLETDSMMYQVIISRLKSDIIIDREEVIRQIESDVSYLFSQSNVEVNDANNKATKLLNGLGISLEEMQFELETDQEYW